MADAAVAPSAIASLDGAAASSLAGGNFSDGAIITAATDTVPYPDVDPGG